MSEAVFRGLEVAAAALAGGVTVAFVGTFLALLILRR